MPSRVANIRSQKLQRVSGQLFRQVVQVKQAALVEAYYADLAKVMGSWSSQFLKSVKPALERIHAKASRKSAVEAMKALSFAYDLEKAVNPEDFDEVEDILEGMEISMPEQTTFVGVVEKRNTLSFLQGAKLGMGQMRVVKPFELRNELVKKAIRDRANMLTGNVSQSMFNQIKKTVTQSFYVDGKHPTMHLTDATTHEVMTSVADDIQAVFGKSLSRCKLIARTETMVVESEGLFEWNQRSGITKHGWSTAEDPVVREAHQENQGVEVEIGELFPSGQLRVGEGPAELVCNCRCWNYPVLSGADVEAWLGD